MTILWIVLAVVLGGLVLTVLYAFVRVPWRLRQGDVESVGRDSQVWARDDKPKPT